MKCYAVSLFLLSFLTATVSPAMSPTSSEPIAPIGKTGMIALSYVLDLDRDIVESLHTNLMFRVAHARSGFGLNDEARRSLPLMPMESFWGTNMPAAAHLQMTVSDGSRSIPVQCKMSGGIITLMRVESLKTNDSELYESRLKKALLKQIAGFVGVSTCEDPKCVVYGNIGSPTDTDKKGKEFCSACNLKFATAVLTREVWIVPIEGWNFYTRPAGK